MDLEHWLSKAAKYCARRETCEFDLRRKLQQWGASGDVVDEVVARLKQQGFIDHSRYAQAFVNDKLRFDRWGKVKIRYALRQKRIEEDYIDAALDAIDSRFYIQVLEKVLQTKMRNLPSDDPHLRQKLLNYAINRGFEYDLTNSILDQILN